MQVTIRSAFLCGATIGCISCNAPVDLGASRSELQSQLTQLRAYNDATNNYYGYAFAGTYDFHRVYIDTDESAATGFAHCGLGANYLVENTHVYQYTGDGTSWSWSSLGTVTANVTTSPATWTVPRSTLGETAFPNGAKVCFETETSANVLDTSALYQHAYTDETSPIHALVAYNDDTNIVYQATYDTSYSYKRVYIDTNEGATSGFIVSGIGAEYMIENTHVYQYTGTGGNWSWSLLGDSSMNPSTPGATGVTTWTIARTTIGETGTSERADIVFNGQPSGGSNVYTAKYDHDYSGGVSTSGTTVDTSYTADTSATLKNPERGMYFGSDPSAQGAYHTLVPGWLWLNTVCAQNLTWAGYNNASTSSVLNNYARDVLEVNRGRGSKVIFRPRYDNPSGNGPDSCGLFQADSKTRQKNHIAAIAAMLHDYRDVVAYIQAGYLGRWGEWNNSGYADSTAPLLHSITDRAEIIDYVLSQYAAQGIQQHVELRRPVFAKEVLDRNSSARVGVHDDCFNTDLYDQGTYWNFDSSNPSNFSSQDAARTWNANTLTPSASFGGETCNVGGSERWRTCSNMTGSTADPVIMHMNYLNGDYATGAVTAWATTNNPPCYDDIRRKLGYRFEVTRAEYTASVSSGQTFTVLVDIHNTGWARLHKPRTAKLVLRNGATTYVYDFGSGATASWAPNTTTRLSVSAAAPPAGTYSIRLWIPDPDNTSKIDYAVKLASQRGGTNVFDGTNGENNLGVSMTVN